MTKVFLDTNVLISATFWEGEAYQLLIRIGKKELSGFTTHHVLDEYRKILKRDFDHSEEETDKRVEKLLEILIVVSPSQKLKVIREDPDDDKILEGAIEAKADYIVTYDARHLLKLKEFEGIKIISPTEFLRIVKLGPMK
jgi:putative PIN family toxin of toxin-antitoxin system